jgi:hypothetical protein
VAEMAGPKGVGHVGGPHRQTGVAGVSLFDHVNSEETQGVSTQFILLFRRDCSHGKGSLK